MMSLFRRLIPYRIPAFGAAVFGLLSLAMLPLAGIQDDEALFTWPMYQHGAAFYRIHIFRHDIPLLLESYLGTLKSLLYLPIFAAFVPSRWSLRLPVVVIGIVSVVLTWNWTRRIAGRRAAAFAVALLSTDAVFIATNTLDWGPVALQHVLLMSVLLCVDSWIESPDSNLRPLALGMLLLGLGLWDKALMIWSIIGLFVAAACVYPAALFSAMRRLRRAWPAIVLLIVGAAPLVLYNVARKGDTLSGNTHLSLSLIPSRLPPLRQTLDGSVLFGQIPSTESGPIERTPPTFLSSLATKLSGLVGIHRTNLILPALALSLVVLLVLLLRRRESAKLPLFLLLASFVTWLQMAANAGTGTGAHHIILIWPFPCLFVAVTLDRGAALLPRFGRDIAVAVVVLLAGSNALVANEHIAEFAVNGSAPFWTDAIYRLAGALGPYIDGNIVIVDWGYLNPVRMLYDGELTSTMLFDAVKWPIATDADRTKLRTMLASPLFVFVQHVDDRQVFPGRNEQLRAAAAELGFTERVERTIHDYEGRPVYEIVRFVPTPSSNN